VDARTFGPPYIDATDARDIAHAVKEAVGRDKILVVTVGLPLCSDGKEIRFGSGIYDPLEEKTLVQLPNSLSDATEKNIELALALHAELAPAIVNGDLAALFMYSVFDAKMVHSLGRVSARRVQEAIVRHPESYLTGSALSLFKAFNRHVAFDFSLDYRARGDKLVDRVRSAVRPCIPSVPTPRLAHLFSETGVVMLRCIDPSERYVGMGRILCATPNTLPQKHATPAHPLDGRSEVRTGFGAIPFTNDEGQYICEVTAIGRILAMIERAAAHNKQAKGIVTLSILNVCDPGNRKIHRMSWSAGEFVSSLLGYLENREPYRSWSQTHLAVLSDANDSIFFTSEPDERARSEFLEKLHTRVSRVAYPRRREDIMAGELERIRVKVQGLEENRNGVVFLYGPGDFQPNQVIGRRQA
jgi:hypothetical protein